MERVVVCKVSEIPSGGRKIVTPFRGSRAGIGVFNIEGSFYAVNNICPHRNGPLCTGELCGRVTSEAPPSAPGATISVDGMGEILRCPWHQWPFEIATGRSLVDPKVRIKTYPVIIEGDKVIVEYEPKGD